jgi:hypothetical protein
MKILYLFIFLLVPGIVLSQTDALRRSPLADPTAKDFHHDYYYDTHAQAFHINAEWLACLSWSPDSRQLLATIHFGTMSSAGAPPPAVQKNLDYLNYCTNGAAFALLVINVESNEISPVKLPFMAQPPDFVSWWDDKSIVLIGNVMDGNLVDTSRTWGASQKIALTRFILTDSSCEQFPIPPKAWDLLDDTGAIVNSFQTVRFHSGLSLVYLSFWRDQVHGGEDGVIFFDPRGDRVGLEKLLNRNSLRDAVQLPGGFAGGKRYWNIPANRRASTPRPIAKFLRNTYNRELSRDGKLAEVKTIPKPRTENGLKIVDMTGPEAFLYIRQDQK